MNGRIVTDFHHRDTYRIARGRVSATNSRGGFDGVKKRSIGMDGGLFYDNGSTRRADCTAYPCSHIPTHAIPASVRNNSHIANSDVTTGSAIIRTDYVSADAAATVIAPYRQLVVSAVARNGDGIIWCHIDTRTIAAGDAACTLHMNGRITIFYVALPLPTLMLASCK